MPIRDRGTGTEDNNICFSNKPVTMRIWGPSCRQHWAQLQPCSCGSHWHSIIAQRDYLPISGSWLVCFILTRGPITALCRIRPPSACFFISDMGWASVSGGSWKPQVPQSRFFLLKAGTKVGLLARATEHGGKSTVLGGKGPGFNPSLAPGSADLDGCICLGTLRARGLILLREPASSSVRGELS